MADVYGNIVDIVFRERWRKCVGILLDDCFVCDGGKIKNITLIKCFTNNGKNVQKDIILLFCGRWREV